MIQDKQIKALRDLIQSAESSVRSARKMLDSILGDTPRDEFDISGVELNSYQSGDDKIVEGVFTGDSMLGPDGSVYPVPQNYSSKSLLVQGSRLKATIDVHGGIKYKIIEEIPFETSIGIVTKNGDKYEITTDAKTYKVLMAAITFHKCSVGDTVSIRTPKGKDATYAVIESIIPKA
ncbi:hypothetical protein K2X92_05630 [Candidatus Gracilibacteria bacterium]|nr:hypothetical protein [Candidatus Gracilibacteria bacterium]